MINDHSNWWRSEAADIDAQHLYIEGQNDALALDKPASNDYYYLCGWRDTKAQLASGKLCWTKHNQPQELPQEPQDDWWNDWRRF